MDKIGWTHNPRPGYRLKKLEVTNWGTFDSTDGRVYTLAPEGRAALLVGQNGSGKSTLVDALLTLLVQPGTRNYNVAAGSKKRERDERSYIRGACGRSSDDELGTVTDHLRPDDKHYSVLLACFEKENTKSAFTIAQVLQITGDGQVDKTYAFDETERSIAGDLGGLNRREKIRKQLIERGFRATSKFSEYAAWISRRANMRPKAMDVFNQTVAVKDIQSLNRFIREHMLEAKPWRERIESLLSHFSQLSQAHQSLIKARRQIELLEPIEHASERLRKLASEQDLYQQQLDAIDSFFRQRTIEWLRPKLTHNKNATRKAQNRKSELEKEINALDDTQRYFKNEIESTGGERLRQLPHQLETQHTLLSTKQRERTRLLSAIKLIGVDSAVADRSEFDRLPNIIGDAQRELGDRSTQIASRRLGLARQLTEVRTSIEDETTQLEFLEQQPGHLPGWLADVRSEMTRKLEVSEAELPFACELISVVEDQYHWQAAIEMVIRRFALTILIPEQYYAAVNRYAENNLLVDKRGRGQQLVYRCIETARSESPSPDRLHADSMVRKLCVREHHPLADWVTTELRRHFDYRCCDSLEQFQRAPGLAMTSQRHIKFGTQQHEKDDRPRSADSRQFVLGWDNAGRLCEIQASLTVLRQAESEILDEVQSLEVESRQLSRQLAAVDLALAVTDFDLLDTARHKLEISKLEDERTAIEESNDAVRVLRVRLEETIERRFAAQKERDAEVAAESNLLRDSDQAAQLLDRHTNRLSTRQADGILEQHSTMFEQLQKTLASRLEGLDDITQFSELQAEVSQQMQVALNNLQRTTEPLREDVIRAMQKFLSGSPEQRDDLRADMLYTDGFLGLLEQLRRDDLPRYESRFQERLNEKVVQEIGVFYAALQCEKQEIATKIDLLNVSLEQLEYRAGTHMRLEPRDVSDREVRDFQALLRECLSDHFDDDTPANEARFMRIEKLIRRLREEERWRDKVVDVRRWYDFTARELDTVTGEERSCYEDSAGQSGGEKAKLAFTILVAAIAYQFDLDPTQDDDDRFHFVVVDEMFSKVDDRYAEYALQLFEKFGLQLLIVAPLDAKARVTEPYVGCYLHTVRDEKTRMSEVISMTAAEYDAAAQQRSTSEAKEESKSELPQLTTTKPR